MHFFTNVSKSRTFFSNAITIASFVAIVSCLIISESSDAGLIEAAKDTACHADSATENGIDGSDRPQVNDPATNQIQAVSLILTHTRNLINLSSPHYARPVNLPAVLGSKGFGITQSDIKTALINAHVSARLKLSSLESMTCESLFFAANEVGSGPDNHGRLSSQLKSYDYDHISQLLEVNSDDAAVFLHVDCLLASDDRRTTSQSTTPTFVSTFVTGKKTSRTASSVEVPPKPKRGQEASDKNESSEESEDETSDEESSDDLVAEDNRLLHANFDSFDPLKASVALLVFAAIALVVNAIPRRFTLETQM